MVKLSVLFTEFEAVKIVVTDEHLLLGGAIHLLNLH